MTTNNTTTITNIDYDLDYESDENDDNVIYDNGINSDDCSIDSQEDQDPRFEIEIGSPKTPQTQTQDDNEYDVFMEMMNYME
jgi:hypothetical protein